LPALIPLEAKEIAASERFFGTLLPISSLLAFRGNWELKNHAGQILSASRF